MTTLLKPVGLDYPIVRGNNGYFQQTFTEKNRIKANILSLLLTHRGER